MQIDVMASVRLENGREIACSNAREVHLYHGGDRCCNATSGETVASTVREIRVCGTVSIGKLKQK
jgi:hypothetical protein